MIEYLLEFLGLSTDSLPPEIVAVFGFLLVVIALSILVKTLFNWLEGLFL